MRPKIVHNEAGRSNDDSLNRNHNQYNHQDRHNEITYKRIDLEYIDPTNKADTTKTQYDKIRAAKYRCTRIQSAPRNSVALGSYNNTSYSYNKKKSFDPSRLILP